MEGALENIKDVYWRPQEMWFLYHVKYIVEYIVESIRRRESEREREKERA